MRQSKNGRVVLIDAGHGGIDPRTGKYTTGARKAFKHRDGTVFHDGPWFYEGVFNRAVADCLASYLQRLHINHAKVYHDFIDTPLKRRVAFANFMNDYYDCIYISIHSNAGGGRGWEVYTSPGQTEADLLADHIYDQTRELFGDTFRYRINTTDGDYDKEERFYVLMHTKCPAVLIEHLFFDNEEEAHFLMQPDAQDYFAQIILRAVLKFWRMQSEMKAKTA